MLAISQELFDLLVWSFFLPKQSPLFCDGFPSFFPVQIAAPGHFAVIFLSTKNDAGEMIWKIERQ